MREQLRKQVTRIHELRLRKIEEPGMIPVAFSYQLVLIVLIDAFYGVEDTALHNVDVMTDASMPMTAFTRYTVAPTATSRVSSKYISSELCWFHSDPDL